MKSITVSAPGKIHLLGEHAVVYGKPSLLAAIDKRCYVSVSANNSKTIKIVSKKSNFFESFTEKDILIKTKDARKKWTQFSQTNSAALLKSITKKPFDYAMICLGEILLYYQKKIPSGFILEIDSKVTAGMGSSSSLAVAIVGAVSLFLGKPFDRKVINEIAFRCEQKQHGYPSGGDNSVSTYGGLVWYRKETADLKIMQPIPFALSKNMSQNFFLMDTGKPQESTGEMVSLVKSFVKKNPATAEKIFNNQEALARDFLSALKNSDEKNIRDIIKSGERNLEKLGVVSSYVKGLIRKIEKSGGVAKICGAGGKTKAAGIVLVYQKNSNRLKNLLKSYDLSYSKVIFEGEGVMIHTS